MTQFYDQANIIKRRYLHNDSFYANTLKFQGNVYGFVGMENNPESRKEILKIYKLTAEILSGISAQDPAFKHFYDEEYRLRKLCMYMHMADAEQPQKQLALLISTIKDIAPAIEVCDAYGFGYAPWCPFVLHGNRPRGIIIDFRNKDYDDPQFLEANQYLTSEYLGQTSATLRSGVSTGTHFSLEYAHCFFQAYK